MFTQDETAIIALCTPRGSGAIALLRLCGLNALTVADKISKLSSGNQISQALTHTIHHGHVVTSNKNDQEIDEVLFFVMHAPKTFTGQDTVEISCHNNPFILEQIIDQAILAGARLAEPGEFTKRAFLNEKIDLIQAEAINEIITAQTELALRKSMNQLHGSLSNFLHELEAEVIGLLSVVESSFEFLEEEQQDLNIDKLIKERMNFLLAHLKDLKVNFNQQQQIRQGIKISMVGWVNVGKSSLFNALLNQQRAIVTNVAGTTRDSIEANLYKNGNFWSFVDTAGLRETNDFIEKEGIQRAWRQAAEADIVLLVWDLSSIFSEHQLEMYENIIEKYSNKIIIVANKVDIQDKESFRQLKSIEIDEQKIIKVSSLQKKGLDLLTAEIDKKIQELFKSLQSPFLLNQRQYSLISELEQKLEFLVKETANIIQYELIAYHLREMLEKLSELTGRNVTERVLDRIFSDFCIGK